MVQYRRNLSKRHREAHDGFQLTVGMTRITLRSIRATCYLLTLEKALSYIEDDELVEITPHSIRLRKRILDPNERKKAERLAVG